MTSYILIIGLGITGFSCIKFFINQGKSVRVVDTRENPPQLKALQQKYPHVPVHLGELPVDWLCQAQEIIISPGLSLAHPAIQAAKAKGISIRGDIDVFADYAKAPIIGITGSNGKSTVTSWLGAMSEYAGQTISQGGNIGVPVLDLLDEPTPFAYVLELSSFQLETTDHLSLTAGTILNISPDHLDRYADLGAYTAAKQRIYQHCQTAVYYRAEPETRPMHSINNQTLAKHAIPAKAQISKNVIPAKAGIHLKKRSFFGWIPAFAGMTNWVASFPKLGMMKWVASFPKLAMAKFEESPELALKEIVSFGLDAPTPGNFGVVEREGGKYLAYGEECLMPVDEISLPGSHNVLNALATLALGQSLNLSFAVMCQGLRAFPGLPHRCKKVAEESGITWINDSKGTNVGATLAAIEGLAADLSGKMILILGGDGKGADFSPLIAPLNQHARAAILLGQDADKLQETLQGAVFLQRVNDLPEAVQKAAQMAQSGDIVLLSPACSSLDMFANYAARGDEFARLVADIVVK